MIFFFFALILCIKKYIIVAEHDSDIHSADIEGHPKILDLLSDDDGKVRKTKIGYTMELSEKTLKKVKKHPRIKHIEEDKEVKIANFEVEEGLELSFALQKNPSWGLSRISGHENVYEYLKEGGKSVIVYVLDTGIDVNHPEFEGRAFFRYNIVENSPDTDEQGHGTHCAGVIGSKSFGVAKKAKLFGVKILDKNGYGSISKMIEGIDFVIDDVSSLRKQISYGDIFDYYNSTGESYLSNNRKAQIVVNMSVGGEKSQALNYAIALASKEHQIHFSTAAGNEHRDACKYSPSSSSTSLTIGASDSRDYIADFSNNGECVNLFAPGVKIPSTWLDNQIKIVSGTSMATPHVAGIMAVYLSLADFTPEELKQRIIDDAELTIKDQGFLPFFSKKKPLASLKSLYNRIKSSR